MAPLDGRLVEEDMARVAEGNAGSVVVVREVACAVGSREEEGKRVRKSLRGERKGKSRGALQARQYFVVAAACYRKADVAASGYSR